MAPSGEGTGSIRGQAGPGASRHRVLEPQDEAEIDNEILEANVAPVRKRNFPPAVVEPGAQAAAFTDGNQDAAPGLESKASIGVEIEGSPIHPENPPFQSMGMKPAFDPGPDPFASQDEAKGHVEPRRYPIRALSANLALATEASLSETQQDPKRARRREGEPHPEGGSNPRLPDPPIPAGPKCGRRKVGTAPYLEGESPLLSPSGRDPEGEDRETGKKKDLESPQSLPLPGWGPCLGNMRWRSVAGYPRSVWSPSGTSLTTSAQSKSLSQSTSFRESSGALPAASGRGSSS